MPDRTGIFLGWSANLSNFLGLGVEAGASPMYPQKMRVPPPGNRTPERNKITLTSLNVKNANTNINFLKYFSRVIQTYFYCRNTGCITTNLAYWQKSYVVDIRSNVLMMIILFFLLSIPVDRPVLLFFGALPYVTN